MGSLLTGLWDIVVYLDWVLYIIAFAISVPVAWSCWMFWREECYKTSRKNIPWVFFEIKIPREVLKGPKAMEQFFAALFPLANRPNGPYKKYWEGEVPRWHVIDIIGKNNEVRFYMRVSYRLAPAVEGLLYANYPEIEIIETADPYPAALPASYDELAAQGYEFWGNELLQTKPPAFSIRTYSEFEQETGDEKGRIIDPFSVLLELVSNLHESEMIAVQFILVPDIHKHWEEELEHTLESLRNTTQQLGQDREGKPQYRFRFRTPGEEGVIKRLEEKRERGAFETTIRYLYIAPKEIYNFNIGYRGIQTYFNQFRHDYQVLERNVHVMTKAEWYYFPWVFHNLRGYWRRHALYDEFLNRFVPEETFAGKLYNSYFWCWCFFHKPMALSVEELATLFHIPTNVVLTQTTVERIESKRLPSPTNLPE
ncbi:MAG: hypothetical protein AAB483_04325 [Patescibacteria group bacterium]